MRALSSQLLCTYDGESHPVLREESESDSVEDVMQRVLSLVVHVWVTFWSPPRRRSRSSRQERGPGQGRSKGDAGSTEVEVEEDDDASKEYDATASASVDSEGADILLGPISSRVRGLFLESVWWLLHRVSGFAFEVPLADWNTLLRNLDPDIPSQHCPQTMAGAAMLLCVSHARMLNGEVEYNQYRECIAQSFSSRSTCSSSTAVTAEAASSKPAIVSGFDSVSKGVCTCVCASRWLNSKHGSGTCMCALRWAVSRCTNGIVESGALVGLLHWLPILLASPPRLAPSVSQYSLSLSLQQQQQQQQHPHVELRRKNIPSCTKHNQYYLYERTIAPDDRAVSDFSLSFLWGAFKHLSCMTPPSTAEELTQETLDSMTAGLKNLLTAPLIIMASGHWGMGLLGSKDDVPPPISRNQTTARCSAVSGSDGDDHGGVGDVPTVMGPQTDGREVEESGRSRWKLLFSWWLDLDQRLAEQKRLCALMPPPTPVFSPTSDIGPELGRACDDMQVLDIDIDIQTLSFTNMLSLPAPVPHSHPQGTIERDRVEESPCAVAVTPVMQHGGVMAVAVAVADIRHRGRGRGNGGGGGPSSMSPCHLEDFHASLDYIGLASEALQVPACLPACLPAAPSCDATICCDVLYYVLYVLVINCHYSARVTLLFT